MAICFPDTVIWPEPDLIQAPADPDAPTPAELLLLQQIELALSYAWTTMQMLTAYQVAICAISVRPCRRDHARGSYFVAPAELSPGLAPFWPSVSNGQWTNIWCGSDCDQVESVKLIGPVGKIVSVNVDGVDLPASAYRVDNGNELVRMDGGAWPTRQNMNAPEGTEGTFTVTYFQGASADIMVNFAVGVLATEFLKSLQGSKNCRLPSGVTTIVRQGITIEVTSSLFADGLTGIPEVDTVVQRFNPYGQRVPSQVFSLDLQPPRRTTLYPGA